MKNNSRLMLFHELLLSVLIYAVVLGFFNDYTNIITARSYSITFLTALVLALLVYPTFMFKSFLAKHFKAKNQKIALVLSVWLVMFFSKFIFLWLLNFIFRDYLDVSGFIGILLIILVATILQKIITYFYQRLSMEI